jgi:hypothetical protein
MKPGYLTKEELWNCNPNRMDRFMKILIPLIKVEKGDRCIDIGERNPKMELIKQRLGIEVRQYLSDDFNFAKWEWTCPHINVIFCLDVLEHLANPLWFMGNLKSVLQRGGRIYLTMPCNPRWLWMDGHFFEMDRKHFEKWIVEPLGMKIKRCVPIWFVMDWRSIFIGVRPLLRVLRGEKQWKSLLRGFLYVRWNFYEII